MGGVRRRRKAVVFTCVCVRALPGVSSLPRRSCRCNHGLWSSTCFLKLQIIYMAPVCARGRWCSGVCASAVEPPLLVGVADW